MEVVSERPWARVSRAGELWLKECRPVQAYEVPLTVALASRWPDRIAEIVDASASESWLLLRDAGSPIAAFGDAMAAWADALPLYAELQRGETAYLEEHRANGAPDLRMETLTSRYEEWAERDPRLAPFAERFRELCASLTRAATLQHDDLHEANIFARDDRITLLDWGDACIGHPFATMYITCRWISRYRGDDAAQRVREIYLDCWTGDVRDELDRVMPVAAFARLLQWERIGEAEAMQRNLEAFLETIVAA